MGTMFRSSAFSRVTALAAQKSVHGAFGWLHLNEKRILDWQTEVVGIPAPPFGEAARSAWLARRFAEAGLSRVETDAVGNVFGVIPAASLPPESTGPVVLLSAHLDTVFPAETAIEPRIEDGRLIAPGASDNGAGIAGMLAIAHALLHGLAQAHAELPAPLVFLGNVGEEGEGDLRGVRHLYQHNPLAGRIAAHIVLDGAGTDTAVVQALGSRRFLVTISGPGGHSFTDAGTPNPIAALAAALAEVAATEIPEEPRTTLNLGTIRGGTSVNSIPESAQASLDFRSTGAEQLVRLEVALHRAVEDAVARANAHAAAGRGRLTFSIAAIGDRPAAHLAPDSAIRETLRAVDRHLGIQTDLRLGSTDANLPLSLGIPALSLGAGGEGGGAHTLAEWYAPSPPQRESGLRRALLLALAMLASAVEE
ncbi:MAG TPA: M20/M25/M40 family metallo-hydrolase [Terracidiphilus sp.]|nr:M20/M25/M40 family metallo-hydrolase [Terracidiphilus sp.]